NPERSSRHASLPSLGDYLPMRLSSLHPARRAAKWPGTVRCGRPTPLGCGPETFGSPRFLANPLVPMPRPWTPVRPTSLALARRRHGPRSNESRGLTTMVPISGLDPTALALAVYASPRRLPDQDARLASGCWLRSTGWDLLPTGFVRKVSEDAPYICFLLPQAFPGASRVTLGVASQGSHRSVRARFRHTARQGTGSRLRVHRVNDPCGGKRVTLQQPPESLPVQRPSVTPSQPFPPDLLDHATQLMDHAVIPGDAIVGVVAAKFL